MRKYILIVFFVSFSTFLFSQEETNPVATEEKRVLNFDTEQDITPWPLQEKIEHFKNDKHFNYEVPERKRGFVFFKKILHKLSNWLEDVLEYLFRLSPQDANYQFLIRTFKSLLVLAFVGLFIWLFWKLDWVRFFRGKKEEAQVILSEEERIIHEEDIPQLIREAIRNKNYRLAVRYYYLLILKKLKEREIINYEFQKTNQEYQQEITVKEIAQQFKRITRIYDFVWYGSFAIKDIEFGWIENQFEIMQLRIKENER